MSEKVDEINSISHLSDPRIIKQKNNLIGEHMKFIEAYICDCGHTIRKYLEGPLLIPAFALYSCCPKCGRSKEKMHLRSGYWKTELVISGIWPFRTTTEIDIEFIQSQYNDE